MTDFWDRCMISFRKAKHLPASVQKVLTSFIPMFIYGLSEKQYAHHILKNMKYSTSEIRTGFAG